MTAGGYNKDVTYSMKQGGSQMWPSVPDMWTECKVNKLTGTDLGEREKWREFFSSF